MLFLRGIKLVCCHYLCYGENMVLGIGIDIIEIARLENALARRRRLQDRLYTTAEIDYCKGRGRPGASLAARFAAKEAVRKACSPVFPGVVIPWREIEVMMDHNRPRVTLRGKAARLASERGIDSLLVSLTHSREYACAVVLVLGKKEPVYCREGEGPDESCSSR